MNEDDPRGVEQDVELALALRALLPPLIHRLNNALAVGQGVLELGTLAGDEEREKARQALKQSGETLARLAVLARAPLVARDKAALDLGRVALGLERLLRPLAEAQGVELELHRSLSAAFVRADVRLEGELLVLGVRWLAALARSVPRPRRLRLVLSSVRGRARLALAANSSTDPAGTVARLEALVSAAGGELRVRANARARIMRLLFLAEDLLACAPSAPRRRARVLLLHGPSEECELLEQLLDQHGCAVTLALHPPAGAVFDHVLLESGLARADPGLLEAVRTAGPDPLLLEHPLRPGEILERLGLEAR